MKNEKPEIDVPNPCDAAWDEMHDQGTSRFCDHCTTPVHDLSKFTRDEALALIEHGGDHVCVRYEHVDGEVFFKDSTSPVWRLSRQLEGARKLLAAAALIVPMLAACDSSQPDAQPDTQPEAVAPIAIDAGGASLKPGAGVAPSFGTKTDEADTPTPPPADPPEADPDETEHVIGKIAVPPPEEKEDPPERVEDPKRNIVVGKPAPIRHKVGRVRHKKGKVRTVVGKPARPTDGPIDW